MQWLTETFLCPWLRAFLICKSDLECIFCEREIGKESWEFSAQLRLGPYAATQSSSDQAGGRKKSG